jgi:hypothetical protein
MAFGDKIEIDPRVSPSDAGLKVEKAFEAAFKAGSVDILHPNDWKVQLDSIRRYIGQMMKKGDLTPERALEELGLQIED